MTMMTTLMTTHDDDMYDYTNGDADGDYDDANE